MIGVLHNYTAVLTSINVANGRSAGVFFIYTVRDCRAKLGVKGEVGRP